jgi:hypothetical protein
MRLVSSRHVARNKHISPQAMRIGLLALGLILLLDLLAAFNSKQLETALSLPTPVAHTNNSGGHTPVTTTTQIVPQTGTRPSPTAKLPSPTPKPSPTVSNMLAQDTFSRPDQSLWGKASDGQTWAADANNAQAFSIANHTGQVSNGAGIYDAVLGPSATNVEIDFSASLNHFVSANIGALVHWTDGNNLYKVFIDGTNFTIAKKVAGIITVLQQVPFSAKDGQSYTFRVRMVGSNIQANVWQTGQNAPANWMLSVSDNALPSGSGGIGFILQNNITATVTSFTEMRL